MHSKFLWDSIKNFICPENYPKLPCPYCNAVKLQLSLNTLDYRTTQSHFGNFSVNKHNTATYTGITKAAKENKILDLIVHGMDFLENAKHEPGKFIAFLECEECHQSVSVTGSARVPNQFAKSNTGIGIKAEHFSPPIPVFSIDESTPTSVAQELLQAFNYLHWDLNASGAKLRRAMEKMCAELGYKEKNLHRSIEAMCEMYPEEGGWLRTLKLVGNEATHSDGVDENDLLHSFEIFEAALYIFKRKIMAAKVANTIPKIEQKFSKQPQVQNN